MGLAPKEGLGGPAGRLPGPPPACPMPGGLERSLTACIAEVLIRHMKQILACHWASQSVIR